MSYSYPFFIWSPHSSSCFSMKPWLVWTLSCRSFFLWPHRDLIASAFRVMEFKVYVTMPVILVMLQLSEEILLDCSKNSSVCLINKVFQEVSSNGLLLLLLLLLLFFIIIIIIIITTTTTTTIIILVLFLWQSLTSALDILELTM